MNKYIPKYILHHSIVQHHIIKHGLSNAPGSLNDIWYYDMELKKIVSEDFKKGVK